MNLWLLLLTSNYAYFSCFVLFSADVLAEVLCLIAT